MKIYLYIFQVNVLHQNCFGFGAVCLQLLQILLTDPWKSILQYISSKLCNLLDNDRNLYGRHNILQYFYFGSWPLVLVSLTMVHLFFLCKICPVRILSGVYFFDWAFSSFFFWLKESVRRFSENLCSRLLVLLNFNAIFFFLLLELRTFVPELTYPTYNLVYFLPKIKKAGDLMKVCT